MGGRKYDPEQLARASSLPPPVASFAGGWTLGQRSLIDVTDHCWYWTGRVDRDGYGRSTSGRLAHRLAYQYWVGAIPDGYHVDHACHNVDLSCTDGSTCMHRRCVNPDHLKARLAVENLGDQYPTRRTHCTKGHEFTADNTVARSNGSRACRTCRNEPERRARTFWVCRSKAARPYDAAAGGVRVELRATDESCCELTLKGGLVALVDAADWSLVSRYKWYPRVDRDHWVYARGIRRVNGKTEWVVLHRLIMEPDRGQRVYHRNRHGLDNRRSNLQIGPKTSGVTWNGKLGKWRAYTKTDGKRRSLGHFIDHQDAVRACEGAPRTVAAATD